MKETAFSPERQLEVLEILRPKLGEFIEGNLLNWGLTTYDFRLVDEAGFGYTGIPIYGPELSRVEKGFWPHIDISIDESAYTGPRSAQEHPTKIILPAEVASEIGQTYGIDVSDFIKGSEKFLSLPTVEVNLGKATALVPEPSAHVRAFAEETILYYTVEQAGEGKIWEWYNKLQMLKDVSTRLHISEVKEAADEMIRLSKERWQNL